MNLEIVISKEGTFEELESRTTDTERELETMKTIKQVIYGEKTFNGNKHIMHPYIGAAMITCHTVIKSGIPPIVVDLSAIINLNEIFYLIQT